MIGLAQVGYGSWGRNVARAFASTPGARLVACVDPSADARDAAARAHPGIATATDLAAVLGRDDVQAVVVATPAGAHAVPVAAALEAGKHVFVEKPLATELAAARRLADLADERGRSLMVGHTFLYNDAVRWVKACIDRGELGELYYVCFQRLNLGRVRDDVNALWNLAPHDVAIAHHWFGERPSVVAARGLSFLAPPREDVVFVDLGFPSGRFAHVHVSWIDPLKTRRAVVVGSRKMLVYDDTAVDGKVTLFDSGFEANGANARRDIGSTPFADFGEFALIHRAGDITIPKIEFREPLKVQAAHFVECVVSGRRPLTDGRSGVDVVETLVRAEEALERAREAGGAVAPAHTRAGRALDHGA